MTPAEIIEAAREAGCPVADNIVATNPDEQHLADAMTKSLQFCYVEFAKIIAAKQREKDAGICEKISDQYNGQHEYDAGGEVSASRCAKAIREQE